MQNLVTVVKIRLVDLKKIVNEEYVKGIPDFLLRDESKKFIDNIRQLVRRSIDQHHSNDPETRQEALQAAEESLNSLELEVHDLLEVKLWRYLSQV